MSTQPGHERRIVARGIELAERAYRLKHHSKDPVSTTKLDNAADILIEVKDVNRFYKSQSMLEVDASWNEERRSLAHEINMVDQDMRGFTRLQLPESLRVLEHFSISYVASSDESVRSFGNELKGKLAAFNESLSDSTNRQGFDDLLLLVEELLVGCHQYISPADIDNRVLILRAIRDVVLTERLLNIDLNQLVSEDINEKLYTQDVSSARHHLAEVYDAMRPSELPEDLSSLIQEPNDG